MLVFKGPLLESEDVVHLYFVRIESADLRLSTEVRFRVQNGSKMDKQEEFYSSMKDF